MRDSPRASKWFAVINTARFAWSLSGCWNLVVADITTVTTTARLEADATYWWPVHWHLWTGTCGFAQRHSPRTVMLMTGRLAVRTALLTDGRNFRNFWDFGFGSYFAVRGIIIIS